MNKRAARIVIAALPDVLQADVIAACERIYAIAKAPPFNWNLKRLGQEAGHPFQSFSNWKAGEEMPKVGYLQDFARAVGVSVRVLVQDARQQGGLGMASTESRQIAALMDTRLGTGNEHEKERREVLDLVRHYLGTLPLP